MRHRQSPIKSIIPALLPGLSLVVLPILLCFPACEKKQPEPTPSQEPALLLPQGVQFRPESALSPRTILEPRQGRPHLLHVEVQVPAGEHLLRLRVLESGPGFEELARRDTSQLDSPLIKESFDIAAGKKAMQARHVLVVADYESGSLAVTQALPNF